LRTGNAFAVQLLRDRAGTTAFAKLLKNPPNNARLGGIDAAFAGARTDEIVTIGFAAGNLSLERPAELAAPRLLA
jgi:hypothetical protein